MGAAVPVRRGGMWHESGICGTMAIEMAQDEEALRARVRLGRQGRLVIPAPLRKALGYQEGQELVAYILDGQLVISTVDAILEQIRGSVVVEPGRSVVDELIEERREEARREDEEEREWLRRHSTRPRSSP
jgi:AbrB family looped-hinge helix DNA binding protein